MTPCSRIKSSVAVTSGSFGSLVFVSSANPRPINGIAIAPAAPHAIESRNKFRRFGSNVISLSLPEQLDGSQSYVASSAFVVAQACVKMLPCDCLSALNERPAETASLEKAELRRDATA